MAFYDVAKFVQIPLDTMWTDIDYMYNVCGSAFIKL